MDDIAFRITNLRRANGLTQNEMASMLGISRSVYTQIELGNRSISATMLKKIADILNVDLDSFFVGELVLEDAPSREYAHTSEYVDGYGFPGYVTIKELKTNPNSVLGMSDKFGSVTVVAGNKKYVIAPKEESSDGRKHYLSDICGALKGIVPEELSYDEIKYLAAAEKYLGDE